MADVSDERVTLEVSDGTRMDAYVARPAEGGSAAQNAAIMVFQEAFGVNAHIRDVTRRFSQQGYLAIAPELFHRTAPGFEGSYTDFPSTRPHTSALTNENLERDVQATYAWVKSQRGIEPDKIVSIGFCMGGRVSYLANSFVQLACAVSFYGGGIAPGNLSRAEKVQAPMLFCWAGRDKHITPDLVSSVITAMRNAGKSYVSVEFSDADHGFFCDARQAYHTRAATEAWALTLAFLRDNLGLAGRE